MDWIPIRASLYRAREIIRLASAMDCNKCEALGACVSFWLWATSETEDGHLSDCSQGVIDDAVGIQGFAQHLIEVGWLEEDGEGMFIPNYDRYMGRSAKQRVLAAERARQSRAKR